MMYLLAFWAGVAAGVAVSLLAASRVINSLEYDMRKAQAEARQLRHWTAEVPAEELAKIHAEYDPDMAYDMQREDRAMAGEIEVHNRRVT